MLGFDVLTAAGLLVLAGNVQCTVPSAPKISINPITSDIAYDFSLSSEELGRFKINTVSPYAPGADTTTGGLRHDRPKVSTEVKWGMMNYPDMEVSCLWYDEITVTIELSPKIYIAKEHADRVCRDAIIEHEIKHVEVDRDVINQYAQDIGYAVKDAVDGIGAMGPYNYHQLEDVREKLIEHVKSAVDSKKFTLYQEMQRRQGQVDSLEEYERVTNICKGTR